MPITRTLTPCKTGRVKFATSTAPRPPLAELVSNPTPPGQITRERASLIAERLSRVLCLDGLTWRSTEPRSGAPHSRPEVRTARPPRLYQPRTTVAPNSAPHLS